MTETNPFLSFIPTHAEKLIIGSFPCFNGKDYGDWYYSGSGRNYFWQLLSEITGLTATTRSEKTALCEKHHIALSDIALRVKRKAGNCSDANLHILEYNQQGLDDCLQQPLKSIFFTSRFVESEFKRLYPQNKTNTFLLPSPSPAANRHIGGLDAYKTMKAEGVLDNPYQFRLLVYKKLLGLRTDY